ncbi:MAG: adenylyltransferase/cytidyltransferase family protein, partial [Candidatus Nanohaloarchaea archaeon]|nr:adenylyltransferase/cytidyltransferase family protein [Candidatus Nanohaloarchaea archaeon]
DLLHPGHLHYLRESRKLGDELYVVIARDSRVKGKKDVVMDEHARREMVDALEVVDEAVLGSEESIFDSVREIHPDVITLGYDQGFGVEELEEELASEGFGEIRVERIGESEGNTRSSSRLRERL